MPAETDEILLNRFPPQCLRQDPGCRAEDIVAGHKAMNLPERVEITDVKPHKRPTTLGLIPHQTHQLCLDASSGRHPGDRVGRILQVGPLNRVANPKCDQVRIERTGEKVIRARLQRG